MTPSKTPPYGFDSHHPLQFFASKSITCDLHTTSQGIAWDVSRVQQAPSLVKCSLCIGFCIECSYRHWLSKVA